MGKKNRIHSTEGTAIERFDNYGHSMKRSTTGRVSVKTLWRQCQTWFMVWSSLFFVCLFGRKDTCNTERIRLFSLILSYCCFLWHKGVTIVIEICFTYLLQATSTWSEKENFHSNHGYMKFSITLYINQLTLSFTVVIPFKSSKPHLLLPLHCFLPLD